MLLAIVRDKQRMTDRFPSGPAFSDKMVDRAEKMEVHLFPNGIERLEFWLVEGTRVIDRRMFEGYYSTRMREYNDWYKPDRLP
jgi:hypothetical protein